MLQIRRGRPISGWPVWGQQKGAASVLSHTVTRAPDLEDLRAPRGALLYSPRSGHGLEEVSLDLMADP